MILQILAYPLISVLSRFAGFTRWLGEKTKLSRIYRSLFGIFVGVDFARRQRDDHVDRVAELLKEIDPEFERTNEEFVKEIREAERRITNQISNGESTIAVLLALAGFFAPPWVAGGLALILIVSVSVRLTSVEVLAYTDPNPEEELEQLVAMYAWNESILAKTHVARNTLGLRIVQEFDPRFYQLYLEQVFVPALRNEAGTIWDTWERMNPELMILITEKFGVEYEPDPELEQVNESS